MASPFFYPNQRGPTFKDLHQQKQFNQQFIQDQREEKRRHAAKQLVKEISHAVDKIKRINRVLEGWVHGVKHSNEHDEHHMHGIEELDHLTHEIEQAAASLHTEVQHSPLTQTHTFHEAQHGDHGAVALFQLITMAVIFIKRIKDLEPAHRSGAKREGAEVKTILGRIRSFVRRG
jgi:hypothetical protein